MADNFDSKGFKKKMAALKGGLQGAQFFIEDTAAFMLEKIVDEVVHGQFVGVISGNFKKSHGIEPQGPFRVNLVIDNNFLRTAPGKKRVRGVLVDAPPSNAPYGRDIRKRIQRKTGKDLYTGITLELHQGDITNATRKFAKGIARATKGKTRYTYTNPY